MSNMKKILKSYLHVMPYSLYTIDFVKFIRKNFENQKHQFIIFKYKNQKRLDKAFVKSDNIVILGFKDFWKDVFSSNKIIKNYFKRNNLIFIHYLNWFGCYLIGKYCKNKKVFWVVWGGDLYSSFNIKLYDKHTLHSLKNSFFVIKEYLINLINFLLKITIINRVSYTLTLLDYERKLLKKQLKVDFFNLEFHYPVSTLNFIKQIKISKPKELVSRKKINILVGNSGSPTNNHIDILYLFNNYSNIKLICPCSYGNKSYIKRVIGLGNKLFKNNFLALTSYFNKKQYIDFLDNNIDVAVFNHMRQEGFGTIKILLALGKKVYLRKENPLFQFLVSNNLRVEDISKLYDKDNFESILEEYSLPVKYRNNKLIKKLFSDEHCLKVMRNIFKD